MNYKEAKALAENIDKNITLYDLQEDECDRIIAIQHGDGSYLEFHSACFRELDSEWFAVFTEHHGFNVYSKDDTQWVKTWNKLSKRTIWMHYNDNI